ncbi:MAG: hypothetical protein UZ18_ATM001002110 [Armatimonadetes bacterium OLB18]|nr:MAG: hypothetical protein UZ18_ATM001002110 [Armatimonadetes bacterium OLB18]
MGDIHARNAGRFQPLDLAEEHLRFRFRQAARGFVKHDHPRASADRPGDLNKLLLPDGETPYNLIGIDVNSHSFEPTAGTFAHGAPVDERAAMRQVVQTQVLRDRHVFAKG